MARWKSKRAVSLDEQNLSSVVPKNCRYYQRGMDPVSLSPPSKHSYTFLSFSNQVL
jgi:hypothetical protein